MLDRRKIRDAIEALAMPALERKLAALDNGRPFNLSPEQIATMTRGELQIEGIVSRELPRVVEPPIDLSKISLSE